MTSHIEFASQASWSKTSTVHTLLVGVARSIVRHTLIAEVVAALARFGAEWDLGCLASVILGNESTLALCATHLAVAVETPIDFMTGLALLCLGVKVHEVTAEGTEPFTIMAFKAIRLN